MAVLIVLLHTGKAVGYTLEEGFLKTIPRQDASLLEVDNINGNIHVSSWGKDSLRIDAVKKVRAGSREDAEGWMEDLEIRIERYDERIKVKTIYPHVGRRWGPLDFIFRRWTKGRVDYTISVPADFDLRLHTVNGGIKVGKIRGDVEAETVNGSVHMEEVEGSVRGRTVNGSVDVRGIDGDVVARSINGSVKLIDVSGSVEGSTTNGSLKAEVDELKGDCRLSATNGSISVVVPEDVSADVDIRTFNGRIEVEVSVTVQGEIGRRSLKGKIGRGGPLLKLRTINGNITVKEGPAYRRASSTFRERSEWPPSLEDGRQRGVFKYSRVEGLALGLEITVQSDRDKAYLSGTYGFERKRWTYRFGGEKYLWRGLSLGADLHDIVDTQDSWIVPDPEATALMLIMGTAARDYFNRQGYGVYLLWKVGRVGRLKVGYSDDRYGSLKKVVQWSLFNPKAEKRENPSIDEGRMKGVDVSWIKELSEDGYIELRWELAGGRFGGDFDFGRFTAQFVGHKRLSSNRSLAVRLRVGLADRELPQHRKFGLGGIGTLRGYDYKEFRGDRTFLAQVEYRLGIGDKAFVPFVDVGYAWPYGQSPKLKDLRLDGGIGFVLGGIRLNVAVAPSRKPRWILRFRPFL